MENWHNSPISVALQWEPQCMNKETSEFPALPKRILRSRQLWHCWRRAESRGAAPLMRFRQSVKACPGRKKPDKKAATRMPVRGEEVSLS